MLLHADSLAMTLFSEAPEMGHLMKSPRPDARGESEGEGAPQKEAAEVEVPFMEDHMAPFVLHWAFSAVFALLFMHVEVATRFMSTLPVLYWCCASFRRVFGGCRAPEETSRHLTWHSLRGALRLDDRFAARCAGPLQRP